MRHAMLPSIFRVPNVYQGETRKSASRPKSLDRIYSTYNESRNRPSNIPSAHEQSICNATMSRIRDLIDEQRHRAGEARRRTAHEESRQDKANIAVYAAESNSKRQETIAYVNAQFAAEPVGQPRHGQISESRASPIDRIDKAQPGARRRVHEFTPLVQGLEPIHQGTVVSVCGC
jgi:hypothetical protein